jgi:hypothetical protein
VHVAGVVHEPLIGPLERGIVEDEKPHTPGVRAAAAVSCFDGDAIVLTG